MFCPKCGSENFDTNKFCKKCGRQLPARSQVPQRLHGLLGQVLDGKYRIEAKLGSGGMGDVYRATRLLIGDSVAIKVLHPHLAVDPQAAERFRREAITATQLRHRNVVALYDVGVAQGVPFILMELAEGFSLRQIINEYRVLPLDFIVTVAAQVSAALDEAHRLGIVHRDIKPENIIANETTNGWQIKILDFGIAKLYNQADIGLTQDGGAMGTPQYMSPEQCLGERLDGRSDIYSLGIVLYEMLCGTVPFKAAAASAIAVFQVQNAPPAPRSLNSEIHPEIEAVILRSLAKSPNDRPRTPQALSQELIKAATAAFKSGFTSVSAEPIAAPDVEPEFDVEGSAVPSGEIDTPSPATEDADATIEEPLLNEMNVDEDGGDGGDGDEPESFVVPSSNVTPDPRQTNGGPIEQETVTVFVAPEERAPISSPAEELKAFDRGDIDLPEEFSGEIETVSENGTDAETSEHQTPHANPVAGLPARSEDPAPSYSVADADPAPRRRVALIAGALLFVGAIFVSGIAAGVWFFAIRDTSVPPKAEPAAADAKPASIQPPAGMAYVAGGEFKMGSDTGDEYSRPAHQVTVKPFFIDLTEVTNDEYKKFVDATGRKPPPDWKNGTFPEGRAKLPATGVDWNDADAYARWIGKRLPTEAEWEFAARGSDGRIYPWGNEWDASLANAGGKSKGMREVGEGGKSPFGLYDMSGNAWEWTASDAVAYPGGKAFTPSNLHPKIIRGGCWQSAPKDATGVNRAQWGAGGESKGYSESGFRCAKDFD